MSLLDDSPTRIVRAGELDFACQVHGTGNGPAIVLIRGLGTQLIEWSPVLIRALSDGGLRVVVFDNRDVGRSSRLDSDYVLADMADDAVALAGALDIDRFHVFGISLGGMVAQLVAVQHPERLLGLFSVMSSSGNPALPQASAAVRDRLAMSAETRAGRVALDVENRARWGSPGYPESEAERRLAAQAVLDRAYHPQGVARQMRAAMADGSRVERLAGIRVPTLVIHGADDPLIPPAAGRDTARCIPGAQYQEIPGMGHNIPDALAPVIARRVLDFIYRAVSG